jgi:hypothetical protein
MALWHREPSLGNLISLRMVRRECLYWSTTRLLQGLRIEMVRIRTVDTSSACRGDGSCWRGYCGFMRYPDGGGLSAGRVRREEVRLHAAPPTCCIEPGARPVRQSVLRRWWSFDDADLAAGRGYGGDALVAGEQGRSGHLGYIGGVAGGEVLAQFPDAWQERRGVPPFDGQDDQVGDQLARRGAVRLEGSGVGPRALGGGA